MTDNEACDQEDKRTETCRRPTLLSKSPCARVAELTIRPKTPSQSKDLGATFRTEIRPV